MDTSTIIQLIGLVLTGANTLFDMKGKSRPPRDFKRPIIKEIRLNVALLDLYIDPDSKKISRDAAQEIALRLKTESYDKLISEYANLKKAFGAKKTQLKKEPLYESIHIFYYKIAELQTLIDQQPIRPYPRIKNICTRGHAILDKTDKKKPKKLKRDKK